MTLWSIPVYPGAATDVSVVDGAVPVTVGSSTTGRALGVVAITSVPVGSRVPLGFVLPRSAARLPVGAVEAAARTIAALPRTKPRPSAYGERAVRGVVTSNVANLAAFVVADNDGLTYTQGQRPLLAAQANHAQNGPYVVGAVVGGLAPLTRPPDWSAGAVVTGPQSFSVVEGALGAGTVWDLKAQFPITVDTTPVQFSNPLLPSFVPDVPGPYGFSVFNVRARAGVPTFQGDPAGDTRFDLLSTDSGTIHVGGSVDLEVVTTRGDGATLRLQVNDTTVRAAVLLAPRNERSRVASGQATVVAALSALVGQTATAIGPPVATTATELRTKHEAHRVNAVHPNPDATNTVPRTEAFSVDGAVKLTALLYDALVAHLTTSSSAAAGWHKDAFGTPHDDFKNLPLAVKPTTLGQAVVALADLRYRVHERHRVQVASPASHTGADAADGVTAATLLDAAVVAYLDALALESPTAPTGEPQGITSARHLYGFR